MSSSATQAVVKDPGRPGVAATVVHKFGGTSIADADRYRHVAALLLARPETTQVTVVSAMKGVTDALIQLAETAAKSKDPSEAAPWRESWHALRTRHMTAAKSLLGERAGATVEWLEERFEKLAEILAALAIIDELPREVLDRVQGLGEVYSAHMLGAYMATLDSDSAVLDARDVLVVERGELGVNVDWLLSAQRLAEWRLKHPQHRVVVTGFIARDHSGRVTTLGRNGSDYSGAIFASLFNADELHIWTDVNGVLSADPRVVPEAVSLEALSYDEACELAYFGAKVVHPQTMSPAISRGLPIIIRNTFQPEQPGTRITSRHDDSGPVKGLTLSPDLALLNLEGTGLIGVPGTAERVFAALREAHVSVVMISRFVRALDLLCGQRIGCGTCARSVAACVRLRVGSGADPARATDDGYQRIGGGWRWHGRSTWRGRASVRVAGTYASQYSRHRAGIFGTKYFTCRR
jgi:aspartokinase/homoserine dehydrogenase 1